MSSASPLQSKKGVLTMARNVIRGLKVTGTQGSPLFTITNNATGAILAKHVLTVWSGSHRLKEGSQTHNWKDKFEKFQLNLGGILNGERFEYRFRNDFVGQCWTRQNLSEA